MASAPEANAAIELRFDVTLEQTYAGISQAFGHMIAASLQSTKWDKRSQALKAVSSVLKELSSGGDMSPGLARRGGRADRANCLRLSCQLLNHVMKDKVMPVRLAAFDLFMDTFAKAEGAFSQAEATFALSVLIEHLVDRLGDSNLRLHESARRCVLFAAEMPTLLGLGAVLARLRVRLENSKGNERTKVYFGILDAVSVLLEHFPGRRGCAAQQNADADDDLFDEADAPRSSADSWTQHDIAPFVVAGMDDTLGQRVRDRAVALAVAVYQTFGMDAMKPLLSTLRPAKQALLKQKFNESEMEEGEFPGDEDDEDEGTILDGAALEGLVVCGSAVRPPPWFGTSQAGSPAFPGAMGDEEMLMDGILEDAGMVFGGTGIMNEHMLEDPDVSHRGSRRAGVDGEMSLSYTGLPGIVDDDFLLEEELRRLGLDGFEDLDEQQALLQSLQCEGNPHKGRKAIVHEDLSVEDLLDSFDDASSRSIEVF